MGARKVIKLTENQLKEIIKNTAQNVINEVGLIRDDELMEYARLSKRNTGLDFDIFVDDSGAYKRYKHPLWVYVKCGHSDSDNVLHIEVSDTPQMPKTTHLLSDIDIRGILVFISQNATLLKMFADEKVDHEEFYRLCKPVFYSYKETSKSSKDVLSEMATLRPKLSGLPTILWIDEGTMPPHWKRVKFQASKEQMTTLQFTSMSIEDDPKIYNMPKKSDLSSNDIQRIKDFVIANKDSLLMVANKEMAYEDFLKVMIKT